MSDPRDRPRAALLGLALLACACQPLNPPQPMGGGGDGGTPCTPASAVSADTVAVTGGVCNPWCVTVRAGTPVQFLNQDSATYLFDSTGAAVFEILLPPLGGAFTPALPAGTTVVTEVHSSAATVTVFAQ